jgi:hypothetical protein
MNETVGQRTYAPPPQPFLAGTHANRVDASETSFRGKRGDVTLAAARGRRVQ